MQPTTPTPGTIFVVWLIVIVAVGFVTMILFKIAVWWGSGVNDNAPVPARVMSRSEDSTPASPRPSLETRNETDGQTDQAPRIKAEQLLTVYRLMREAGIDREPAAAAFKAADLPFNNNVWRDAAPPPKAGDDEIVTPFAGRRTRASYYPDQPELEYRSPA